MELDNFILKEYNESNSIHNRVIDTLDNDSQSQKFIGSIHNLIKHINKRKETDYLHNTTYIVYYRDIPIGFIALTHNKEDYEIICGLLKEKRKRHLGTLLLLEFSKKVFESYKDIEVLTLKIKNENIGSIKSAKYVGYKEERDKYTMRR